MRFYKCIFGIIFLFISLASYPINKDDIAEGNDGRGNRSGEYPFGIESIENVIYITFYQTIENAEISVLSESSECICRDAFSP